MSTNGRASGTGDDGWLEIDAPRDAKAYRGVAMEGAIARWYARTRGSPSQREAWRRDALELSRELPAPAEVLEVAPGPGYFAVELARRPGVRVTALDISRTFVEMTAENARRAGVAVTVARGDASQMPFPDRSFDLVVCQAAFKNFSRPQAAITEMYRVLRPGGVARIQDLRRDASDAAIATEVDQMGLGGLRAWFTRRALMGLRRRAYAPVEMEDLARSSPFRTGRLMTTELAMDLQLVRPKSPEEVPVAAPAEWVPATGLPLRPRSPNGSELSLVAGLARSPFSPRGLL